MSNGARDSFDEVVVPHLNAAYRLARWMMGNPQDAEDAVQEASLRAFRYFRTFTGGDSRAWFFKIVRNICLEWRGRRPGGLTDSFDEQQHSVAEPARDPEALALSTDATRLVAYAMHRLPDRFRELLVGRELEGLSYRELADAMDVPIGTVMSGLSRARLAFRSALDRELQHTRIAHRKVREPHKRSGRRRWKRLHAAAQPSGPIVKESATHGEVSNGAFRGSGDCRRRPRA
jgi:RNA polymerase sigma-70 factor (ECF subfamily)